MADHKTKTGVVFMLIISFVESQITSSLEAQTVCVGDNVDLNWVYGNAADYSSVTWSHTDSSSTSETIMQLGLGGGNPTVVNNFNVVHKDNGQITLTNVNEENSGSYKIRVTYLSNSPVEDSVSVTVKDCTGTTVPTTSSTTSPPTSSTTTKSPDIPVVIIVPSVVVVILLICIIVCILLRKKSNRKKKYKADSENVEMPQVGINVTE